MRVYNVLFVCTANSARSIMAESILNALGGGRFRGFSAGSHPAGRVNPLAVEILARHGYDTQGARSKDWAQFAGPKAQPMDFVITVCDNAAGEVCPLFPGHPVAAHWGIPDPAAAKGSEDDKRKACGEAFNALTQRIQQFIRLPFESVDPAALGRELREIGER